MAEYRRNSLNNLKKGKKQELSFVAGKVLFSVFAREF